MPNPTSNRSPTRKGWPWETFLTYGESTVYGEGSLAKLKEASEAACCAPTCCEPEAILQAAPQPAAASACLHTLAVLMRS